MNRYISIVFTTSLLSLLLFSCQRDIKDQEEITYPKGIATKEAAEVTDWSVKLTGYAYLPDSFPEASSTRGFVISSENTDPTVENGATNYPVDTTDPDFALFLSGLKPGQTYYYRSYICKDGVYEYGDVQTFTTPATPQEIADHAPVDLGLSVRWASSNLGATLETDSGKYYPWGVAPKEDITDYTWTSYPWYADGKIKKYCTVATCGAVDGINTFTEDDDPVTNEWGGSWRTPTVQEVNELLTHCKVTWTSKTATIDGAIVEVPGLLISNKQNSRISIFLPAAGLKRGKTLEGKGISANYWTASLFGGDSYYGRYLCTNMQNAYLSGIDRYIGMTIRPVTK